MSDSTQEQIPIKVEAVEHVVMSEEETDATEPRPSTTTSTSNKPTTDTKKKRKKGKWKPTHPNSTVMCLEAIQSLKEGKGSSAQAIKKYILATYTTVRPDMVNYMVRNALTNGIKTGAFARPKGDESSGAHGRFKIGKIPLMPTKTTYKPSSHKKASSNKKAAKKELKNKKNDKKGKNTKKSKKKTASKKKKTKPSNKATLKVKASPKPKRAKKKD